MTDAVAERLPRWKAARDWRMRRGWLRSELAAMTGYSLGRIQDFEAGFTRGSGEPITDAAWKRYQLVCAAIDAGLVFDWGQP